VEDSGSDVAALMYAGVGGSMILYAADWPRLLPSDFRTRTLDGVGDDWPLNYASSPRSTSGRTGLRGGRPRWQPRAPGRRRPPLPPLPIGAGGLRVARAHDRLGWHWWPAPNAVLSRRNRGRNACAQYGACMQGCPEARRRPPTSPTGRSAIAAGAQLRTGRAGLRILTNSAGLAAGGRSTSMRKGAGTTSAPTWCCWPRTRSGTAGCC